MRMLAIMFLQWAVLQFTLRPGIAQQLAQSSEATNKVQYELQERCGRRAAEIWKTEYDGGRTADGNNPLTYENHYSRTLNKCFFLEISHSYEKEYIDAMERLFDANENKEYGSFYDRTKRMEP